MSSVYLIVYSNIFMFISQLLNIFDELTNGKIAEPVEFLFSCFSFPIDVLRIT
jgi:hypothetical protein